MLTNSSGKPVRINGTADNGVADRLDPYANAIEIFHAARLSICTSTQI
jgi:hypothetical protein